MLFSDWHATRHALQPKQAGIESSRRLTVGFESRSAAARPTIAQMHDHHIFGHAWQNEDGRFHLQTISRCEAQDLSVVQMWKLGAQVLSSLGRNQCGIV